MKSNNPALPLLDELAAVQSYLTAAQEMLQSGHMPDITSLEKRIAALCKNVEAAPKEAYPHYLTELTAALKKLNELEERLKNWRVKNPE